MDKHEVVDTWHEKTETGAMKYLAMCSCGEILKDTAQDFEQHLQPKGN